METNYDVVIEEYLKFIQIEKGLSANTIGAYRRDLNKYKEYLVLKKINNIDFIDREIIQHCLGYLHDDGHSAKVYCSFYFYRQKFSSVCFKRTLCSERSVF